MLYALGIDPGFRNTGYAIATVSDKLLVTPVELGVISTIPSKDKKILKSVDNLERTRYIFSQLEGIANKYSVKCILAESMSYPRNASAAAKMSLCWGALAAISETRNVNLHQVSPQKIKRVITGLKKASKQEVQDALNHDYKALCPLARGINASLHEHAYDAFASIITLIKAGDLSYLDLLY